MTQSLEEKLSQTYKYFVEDRSPAEIQLTSKLVHVLSQVNLDRIQQRPPQMETKKGKKSQWFYVCVCGAPPYDNEFDHLNLPGDRIQFRLTCFQKGLTDEQIRTIPSGMEDQARELHSKIQSQSKGKPLVFVFHSFGSYVASTYFKMFPDNRIIGIIDVGGAPIRFYPFLKDLHAAFDNITPEFLEEHIDMAYEQHKLQNAAVKLSPYENKYQLLSVFKCMKQGKGFKEIFSDLRELPNVLKCFIYGRRDVFFPEALWNEKPIHYCYKNRLNPQYQSCFVKAFTKLTGSKCSNVQQKYIFSIPGGYHSIHLQRIFKDTVEKIVAEYLDLLEQQQTTQSNL